MNRNKVQVGNPLFGASMGQVGEGLQRFLDMQQQMLETQRDMLKALSPQKETKEPFHGRRIKIPAGAQGYVVSARMIVTRLEVSGDTNGYYAVYAGELSLLADVYLAAYWPYYSTFPLNDGRPVDLNASQRIYFTSPGNATVWVNVLTE